MLDKAHWTITDLARLANVALRLAGVRPVGTHAAQTVSERTIRYYTTIGLLDRPVGWHGVQGRYGRRHLLQLLAIKRLQSEGASTRQLGAELAGVRDTTLERVARLPMAMADLERLAWERPADGPSLAPAGEIQAGLSVSEEPAPYGVSGVPDPSQVPLLFQAVNLPNGLVLLCPAERGLTGADVQAVTAAVRRALIERGLLPPL
jgi:DNA-binding transcriptional MerR regulator